MSRTENKEYMLQLVQQWKNSGISQAAFAKSKGIHILKFRYWLQKSEGCQAKGAPFIELTNPAIQNINIRYPSGVEISLPSVTSIGLIKSLIEL